MAKFSYEQLKAKSQSEGGLDYNPAGGPGEGFQEGVPVSGTFTGTVTIEVPQLPEIKFPMEDLTFTSSLLGVEQDVNKILSIKDGKGGKISNYSGKQVLINSDRLTLNARNEYLMLFGRSGIAVSSPGPVNIEADSSVTVHGDDGLFLGVPGKGDATGKNEKTPKTKADATVDNDYEPVVLGTKLANLFEDLLVILKNATLLTPVGKGYFREDVMYELACLQARLPEILSSYAFVDGITHEAVDTAPEAPKTVTEPPTTLTGTVTGEFTGVTTAPDPNAPSQNFTHPLADQPEFFDSETLYNDPLTTE